MRNNLIKWVQLLQLTVDNVLTVSAGKRMVIMPSMNDWAHVNNPKKMKFIGAVRRTFVQQAIAMSVTKSMANATHNSSGWVPRNLFVLGWKTHNEMKANEMANWHWNEIT